jgi:hypothetical protein
MSVVTVRDAADRVTQNLDGRLGQVLIVVRRTRLPEVLQFPRLVYASVDLRPRLDASEDAKLLEACVWACSPASTLRRPGERAAIAEKLPHELQKSQD